MVADWGPGAKAFRLEMSSSERIKEAIVEIFAGRGIDVLVNHTSVIDVCAFLEMKETNFDAMFQVNVKAMTFTLIAVAKPMVAAGKLGPVVNRFDQFGSTTRDRASRFTTTFNVTTFQQNIVKAFQSWIATLKHHRRDECGHERLEVGTLEANPFERCDDGDCQDRITRASGACLWVDCPCPILVRPLHVTHDSNRNRSAACAAAS